ncbi:sporulation integral membrane protein YtvI [Gottschalkia purinilytica]|uniref:Sporulation integral membrane protein YtvI n=1 Tax=Gottschalkia purinilytica TaxID=1503 RepID=A0A0L0W8U3_GOTPU|nr:sporulation integral membrane protein YtvI [Gottschalkia purinilytica]KNF07725.1 sporulation integral membrane protein YtvI [Gottschalkia purinilytica]
MNMFNEDFKSKLIKTIIFLAIYTVLFALFFSTLSYTLPFVLAFSIAIFTKPLTRFLKKKLRFSNGISAFISTVIVFAIILSIISVILLKIVKEGRLLIQSLPDFDTISAYIETYVSKFNSYYAKIDFSTVQKFYNELISVVSRTLDITVSLVNKVLSLILGLPLLLMIAFITFLSTYFFSKDMPDIENKVLSIFSPSGKEQMKSVIKESGAMLTGYIKAYASIISLTFVETFIGFSILKIDYALILSILSAVVDVLPVLGVGSVYVPLAIIYYFLGKKFISIGLLILFVIVSIVRQVVEPKLVSTNLGIHPVFILAAIFIGLKAYGFLGMIYLIGLVVLYKVFTKVKIL